MARRDRFFEELGKYVRVAERARKDRQAHDYRRHLFLGFIERAFGIEPEEISIERGVEALKLRGRIDALYRDLVFEFKRDLEAERDTGKRELSKYLRSPQVPKHGFGIITDGITFEVYALHEDTLRPVGQPVDLQRLEADAPDAALLWFDSFLFSQKNLAPTSADVLRRFGADSAVFSAASASLLGMLEHLKEDGTTQVKFAEWNSLLAKVYGSREVGTQDLFIRHTYLSLLAKVLAYLALFKRHPRGARSLTEIVDGEVFRRNGLLNLAEEDFFAWVLSDAVRNDAVQLLNGMLQHLYIYSPAKINEDLLKELYQGLVDPETRHDLGEFYTPDWLAELTLTEAGYKGKGSVLDPACGSGTFLFVAIRQARRARRRGTLLATYAQRNIMGVDVHPLAVTISRVNYALALAPDLKQHKGNITIPVYMADALLQEESRQGSAPIRILVGTEERFTGRRREEVEQYFHIPASMAKSPILLDDVIDTMCDYARRPEGERVLTPGFREYVARKWRHGDSMGLALWQDNLKLMIRLVRQNRDTVWGFILRNAYRPIYLSNRRFNFVVGNPPWLAYRYIQDARYQAQVKKLVFRHGLLDKSDVKLFTVMDTSTLFYEFSFGRYVGPKGTLAFVMPKSTLTGAKQHLTFQRLGFTRGVDLEGIAPLFNVPACLLVRTKGKTLAANIPMLRATGSLPARNLVWDLARPILRMDQESYSPLPQTAASHYWSSLRAGASIFPRCFWFVRPAARDEWGTVSPERPYVETTPDIQKDAKTPWRDMRFEGPVEADFLYATLLGKHLLPFGHLTLDLVVLPLQPIRRGTNMGLLTREAALSAGYPALAEWLAKTEAAWADNKKTTTERTIYNRLDYQHTLTCQVLKGRYKLLYNKSGTHLTACVVNANRALDAGGLRVNGFAADMVTYYYETKDEDEAHYLCSLLNSSAVNQAIKPYQTSGQWGERDITRLPFEVLPIPRYDAANATHERLATLSKECHRAVAALAPQITQGDIGRQRSEVRRILTSERVGIDELVWDLLGHAAKQPVRRRRGRRGDQELPIG